MKKQLKKVCAMVLIASCIGTIIPTTIKAEERIEDNGVQPILTILDTVCLYLEKSGEEAVISGLITADPDATKVCMQFMLQKYSNGSWTTVYSSTKISKGSVLNFSTSYTAGSGKYRVSGIAYAYIGTKTESLSVLGNSVTF